MKDFLLLTLIQTTLLAFFFSASANAEGDRAILVLHSQRTPIKESPDEKAPLLQRELFRQAVLLAAREEMGLLTRDTALRETIPANGEVFTLFAGIDPAPNREEGLEIGYFLQEGEPEDAGTRLAEDRLPMLYRYEEWTGVMEELSRTVLPEVLRANGMPGRSSPNRSATQVDLGKIEENLVHLSELSQFHALRLIHAGLQHNPKSRELLGAAVRAYSNLGQLTREHWSVEHKVYQARALLYAERLVIKEDRSRWSLAHRAYARALVGRHRSALADLEAVSDSQANLPWLHLIDKFLRFDTSGLLETVEQNDSQLAALLACLSVEFSTSRAQRTIVEESSREASPDALRVHAILYRNGGIGLRRYLPVQSRANLLRHVIEAVPEMAGLPEETKQLLRRIPASISDEALLDHVAARAPGSSNSIVGRLFSQSDSEVDWWSVADLVKTLRTDRANALDLEPSWSMLATLIEETNFARVRLHLDALVRSLGMEVEDDLREHMKAEASGHPFHSILPTFWVREFRGAQGTRALLTEVNLTEVPMVMMPLVRRHARGIDAFGNMTRYEAYRIMVHHGDRVYDDLLIGADNYVSNSREQMLSHLLAISPNDPHALSRVIEHAPHLVEDGRITTPEDPAKNPQAAFAAAQHLKKQGDLKGAAKLLEQLLPHMPDLEPSRYLADIYLEQGDEERWLQTLEHFIEHGHSRGLLAARARETIARHFLKTGRVEQALPYAEAAARTWAQTPMVLAAECYFAAGDMERSLYWFEARHSRYPRDYSPIAVYYWRLKTGLPVGEHDREKAHEAVVGHSPNDYWAALYHGTYHFYQADAEEAVELTEMAFRLDHQTPRLGLVAAMMADHHGLESERDRLLKAVAESEPDDYSYPESRAASVDLANAFLAALSGESEKILNRERIKEVINSAYPSEKTDLTILVGHFLDKRGMTDEALHYYRSVLDPRHTNGTLEPLVYNRLRAHGVDIHHVLRPASE